MSARLAVEHDPADAARSLAEAERLGRESLAEVRTTVGMLREDGDMGRTAPPPGVGGLPTLVDRFRSAGADVTFAVDGETGRLPATVGLALYRILQEALTNVIKHAPGSPATVHLTVDAAEVRLSVHSMGPPGTGTGLGIISMRERAESLGGSCHAGPAIRAGWSARRSRSTAPQQLARRHSQRCGGGDMIKVLLVDDQELVRAGLRGILRSRFGFDIVGECPDGTTVVAAVQSLAPDVVADGRADAPGRRRQATRQLRSRDDSPPVLALTTFDDEEVLAGMLRAWALPVSSSRGCRRGAAARGARRSRGRRLAGSRGHRPGAGHLPLRRPRRPPDASLDTLTSREAGGAGTHRQGKTNAEIAAARSSARAPSKPTQPRFHQAPPA